MEEGKKLSGWEKERQEFFQRKREGCKGNEQKEEEFMELEKVDNEMHREER